MNIRAALLAMLLLDLAAGATWFAGRYGPEQAEAQRAFLLWVLPALIYLCGLLTREPKPRQGRQSVALPRLKLPGIPLPALPPARPTLPLPNPSTSAGGQTSISGTSNAPPAVPWLKVLSWLAVAIAVDLAPFAVGDRLGWLTFAFSDERPPAAALGKALWALPLLVLLAIRFSERTLRGQLFDRLGAGRATFGAWATTVLCGTALALPALAPGFDVGSPIVLVAGLVTAVGREIGAIVLYRAAGWVASGLYRGVLLFLELFWIADGLRPVFAAAEYGGETVTFHLVRGAAPLAAALLLARALARRSPSEARPAVSGAS